MLFSLLSLNLLLACSSQPSGASYPTASETSVPVTPSFSPEITDTPTEINGDAVSKFPKSILSDSISLDSVGSTSSIRAETDLEDGELLMISGDHEERGHLIVPSVLGAEGDETFQSNYQFVYRKGNDDKVLLELPAFLYVQPTDKILSFDKVSFKEADIFLLTPQYRTGHGLEAYLFAADKQNGNVFSLEIRKGNTISKTLLYSEQTSPFNQNEQLVVYPPIGAGTPEKDAKEIHYKLDLRDKQFIVE
ncbi:hypothetical protein KIH86_20635 [Paenibacillus sp. HN-1]|uniref:hypothetical protein n=1 Tax=Paenibacillus TaxID=44249 RepID=UPI001CA7F560|nr:MULTISPECIES: hypothetical protein [Paenibacillus]MBY9077012.1 hypothetical protein [Paenibacillus sp. CGMCC 1.18879]MBY9086615.1 hypothetical protein [Paenibacillus sinensis]